MERRRLVVRAVTMVLAGRVAAARAPAEAAAAVVGGAVTAGATPGFRLRLARAVRQPGWVGGFEGASVTCVVAGELAVGLDSGYAAIWRADGAADGRDAEPLLPGSGARIGNGDCVAADVEGSLAAGSLRNLGPEPADVWEAGLAPMPLARTPPCAG